MKAVLTNGIVTAIVVPLLSAVFVLSVCSTSIAQVQDDNLPEHAVRILGDASHRVEANSMHFIDDDNIFVVGKDGPAIVSMESGEVSWLSNPVDVADAQYSYRGFGPYLVTSALKGDESKVFLQDVRNPSEVMQHDRVSFIRSVSPDGRFGLVVEPRNNELQVILMDGGTVTSSVPAPEGAQIRRLRFVKDATAVAIAYGLEDGSQQSYFQILEFDNTEGKLGTLIDRFDTGEEEYFRLDTHESGSVLVVSGIRGTLGVRDFVERQSAKITSGQTSYRAVAINPADRSLLAAINTKTIEIWDLDRMRIRFAIDTFDLMPCVCFSPDGSCMAVCVGGQIRFWDVESGREINRVDSLSLLASLAVSLDGQQVAVADRLGRVEIRDVKDGKPMFMETQTVQGNRTFGVDPYPSTYVGFSNDGSLLLGGSNRAGVKVNLWETGRGKSVQQIGGHQRAISGIAWSPDNTLVALMTRYGNLRVIDQNGELIADSKLEYKAGPLFLSDQHVCGGSQTGVHVVDLATGNQAGTFSDSINDEVILHSIAASRLAERVAGVYANSDLIVWDSKSGDLVFKRKVASSSERPACNNADVAFSADGRTIAVCVDTNDIAIFDAASGDQELTLKSNGRVVALAFSDEHLYSASTNHQVTIWDVPN